VLHREGECSTLSDCGNSTWRKDPAKRGQYCEGLHCDPGRDLATCCSERAQCSSMRSCGADRSMEIDNATLASHCVGLACSVFMDRETCCRAVVNETESKPSVVNDPPSPSPKPTARPTAPPDECDASDCELGFVLRPEDQQPGYCDGPQCTNAECCSMVATCDSAEYLCSASQILRPEPYNILCASTVCTARDDQSTCCIQRDTCGNSAEVCSAHEHVLRPNASNIICTETLN